MSENELLTDVIRQSRETALLESTLALLEWDERTGMPKRAGSYRAEQVTLISGMIHRRKTDPKLGDRLNELTASELAQGDSPQAATITRLHKDFRRNVRLPVELVEATSKATVLGQQAWEAARADNDWNTFEPHLAEIYSLRRQEAELLCDEGALYDALLDQYEEGARSEQLTTVLGQLRDELTRLVQEISQSTSGPDGNSWQRSVPLAQQRDVSQWIAAQIGYDYERGRLDETTHPFCTTLGPHDCRILTRYQESYFPSGFYGTLHEAGHGLYEQGLPTDWYGLPPGRYASLGVHESQSRLWENFVGRSQAFWQWCLPHITTKLDGAWTGLQVEDLFRDTNLVKPSLIRVEADEVTYNLHIMIRFELEQLLITGELAVADAPDAWNERYESYLGVRPPDHRTGILQDVHWSAGLVGYFPTYTLGNVYAAQLMQAAAAQLGDLEQQLSQGQFRPLLDWLRTNIHSRGFCLHPGSLIEQVCNQPLDAQPLVTYLRDKLAPIYDL